MTEPKNEMSAEEQAAARKKSESQNPHHPHLGVGHFGAARRPPSLLSQCAMSKPQAKQNIFESCVKNIPFAEKWQNDLKESGLDSNNSKLAADYCTCMWDKPLDKLSEEANPLLRKTQPARAARSARRRASI